KLFSNQPFYIFLQYSLYCHENIFGLENPPVEIVVLCAEVDEILQAGVFHFLLHVIQGIDKADPASVFTNIFMPFLVITIVGAMEIQHIFTDEYEFVDVAGGEYIDDLTL